MIIEAMKATPHKQLIDELMDSRIPKTEREHAAAREIERLRQAIEAAEKQEPVAWHEPGAYGNVTTHKDWALANGWEPLYTKEKNCG